MQSFCKTIAIWFLDLNKKNLNFWDENWSLSFWTFLDWFFFSKIEKIESLQKIIIFFLKIISPKTKYFLKFLEYVLCTWNQNYSPLQFPHFCEFFAKKIKKYIFWTRKKSWNSKTKMSSPFHVLFLKQWHYIKTEGSSARKKINTWEQLGLSLPFPLLTGCNQTEPAKFSPLQNVSQETLPKIFLVSNEWKKWEKIPRYLFSQLVYDCQGKLLIFRVLEDLID